jgi:hypothetical protein
VSNGEAIGVERRSQRENCGCRATTRTSWQPVALFAIPLTLPLTIGIGGHLLVPELLFFLCLPFLLKKRHMFRDKLPRTFFLLAAVWFLGQVVTDIIRHSELGDLMRGWAGILFLCTNFLAIYALVDGRRRRLAVFIIGLGLGGVCKALFAPSALWADEPLTVSWKFGLGQSVSLLVLVLPFLRPKRPLWRIFGIIAQFILAPVHLFLNARSLCGILTAAGAANAFCKIVRIRQLSLKAVILIAGLTAGTAWSVTAMYQTLAAAGYLGAAALSKYQKQTEGSLNMLVAGRSEVLGSIPAIIDSPIIGHGSWARDIRYVLIRLATLERSGYEIGFIDDRIPTHSALLGAWVQAGMAGAVFWGWIVILALRAGFRMFLSPSSLPLAAYMICMLLWDSLFSPLGMEQRILIPAYVSCAMLVLERRLQCKPIDKYRSNREAERDFESGRHWQQCDVMKGGSDGLAEIYDRN